MDFALKSYNLQQYLNDLKPEIKINIFIKKLIYLLDFFFPVYWLRLRKLRIKYNRLKHDHDLKTMRLTKLLRETDELYRTTKHRAENIRSSINYAKSIQDTILPLYETLNQFFQTFVLFQPRDTVSGDFYWISKNLSDSEDAWKAIFILTDCTGHGVPGAFMTLITERLINESVYLKQIHNPAKILYSLNYGIENTLKQHKTKNKDGMDAAVCLFEKSYNHIKVTYAGAKLNLIYYLKDTNEIQLINGCRTSIGGMGFRPIEENHFKNHILDLYIGDRLFMYTDGLTDQFDRYSKKFTKNSLLKAINENTHLSLQHLGKIVEFEWKRHKQFEEQLDDITFIGIEL